MVYWTGAITSLDVIDPNPHHLLEDGSINTDTFALALGPDRREAAAADGVTRLVLRNAVPGPGTVEFSLDGAVAPEDGGLAALGSSGRENSVSANAVETPYGFMAFAVYTTPDEFARTPVDDRREREISFKASYTPQEGPPPKPLLQPFKLVRPPLVLIHGLWSEAATWMPTFYISYFNVTAANYQPSNAAHFSQNLLVPQQSINAAVTRERMFGTAATQVDVVGHSMGGLLARNHAKDESRYRRKDNFMKGDIHKLITLDTPHTGSPWASLLVAMRREGFGSLFADAENRFFGPITDGAIDDLANGSVAINDIEQTPIPAHALVGIGGGPIPSGSDIIRFFGSSVDPFEGYLHDGIVTQESQVGGLSFPATSTFAGPDGLHWKNTKSQVYATRVKALLNKSASEPEFDQFPAPRDLFTAAPRFMPQMSVSLPATVLPAGSLMIVAPATGTVVTPGALVHVIVDVPPGVTRVLLVGRETSAVDDAAPFEFDLLIPERAAGSFSIKAFGASDTGAFAESNTVTLSARPTASLQSLQIVPRDLILVGPGSTQSLGVLGTYSDGLTRDITDPSTGTTYVASSPAIASVSPAGVVTGGSPGAATVVARNGPHQISVAITVLPSPVAAADPD